MRKIFLVRGIVQGVAYRANTQREAVKLGVVGWVKNLPSGDVEVFACGGNDALLALETWLWRGPRYAQVDDVLVTPLGENESSTNNAGTVYQCGNAFEILA